MPRRALAHALARRLLAGAAALLPTALPGQAPVMDSTLTLLASGARQEAQAYALAAVRTAPRDPWANHAVGFLALMAGDLDAAQQAAERSVTLAPTVAAHHVLLGQVLLRQAGRAGGLGALGPARKGKASLERGIELDPGNVPARVALVEYHLQAPGMAGGSRDEAKRLAAELGRLDARRGFAARLKLAASDERAVEVEQVFDEGLRMLAAERDSGGVVFAALLEAAAGARGDARREALTARLYAARGNDPVVRYARARLWIIQGTNLASAEQLLRDYLALPEPPPGGVRRAGAHWRLAQALEKQQRTDEALAEYRQAVAADPGFEEAKKDLARLERRKK